MVDQGSGVEIMYPDLYKGLNLKSEDLTTYDSPSISFDGKIVIPRGQIRLPVQVGSKVVEGDFIVMDAYSPYTTIVARPWLHALRAVSLTMHLKVKYPSGDQIEEDQQQGKGKGKVIPQERRDFRLDCYNNNRPRKDFARQSGPTAPQVVSTVF